LQALSLDIKVWGDNREEIVLREIEEDDTPPISLRREEMPSNVQAVHEELDDIDLDDLSLGEGELSLADEVEDKLDDEDEDENLSLDLDDDDIE